jgi:3-deoxy-D-manno-octulosonic-acid transferase
MRSLLYSALMHCVRVGALGVMWWQGRKVPAFRERWNERRARIIYPDRAKQGIVVHAVSMGEVIAAIPLVQQLREHSPQLPITVTCTTPTASALIKERLGDLVTHVYMPFDTPGAVRRLLQGLQPRLLILMETELWPKLIDQAQRLGVRVVAVNARLSDKSARRYALASRLIGPTLTRVDLWLAQDAETRKRLIGLGIAPAHVKVTGNLKFDTPVPMEHTQRASDLAQLMKGREIWLAASTHAGEEEQVLQAHRLVLAQRPRALLVLVPRHPQRFDAVAQMLVQQAIRMQQQSKSTTCSPDTQVWLADSMGELMAWFALAPVVFMGGSLIAQGGHNPLEPAQLGTAVISGPHVFNFQLAFDALQSAQAMQVVQDASGLAHSVLDWLARPDKARAIGARGKAWYSEQQGAVLRCMRALEPMLSKLTRIKHQHLGHALNSEHFMWDAQAMGNTTQPVKWFDLGYWRAQQAVLGQASGRGTAWFLKHAEGVSQQIDAVWRHYHRGGLVGKMMGDRFLKWSGSRARSTEEFNLLARMRAWQLPVPRPLAARVHQQFAIQRCDILVERIAQAQDWVALLQHAPLAREIWQRAGQAIASLHANGVYHSDLNAHNLLVDSSSNVWIIDFDKCEVRLLAAGAQTWQQANLARLERSLRKEEGIAKRQGKAWYVQEADWQVLHAAYSQRYAELRLSEA